MANSDPAARRFWAMQLARMGGIGIAVLGILIIAGKIAWPEPLGMVLFAVGAAAFFALPVLLARRWKSPGP